MQLFIVHAPADAWFVEGFLLEALRLFKGEVLVSSQFEPGSVIVKEIERGALCPVTVVVVSRAFLASPWAQFAHQLAMHQSIEAAKDGSATLVPAILEDCDLPLLTRFRKPLDFRNPKREHWEAEAAWLRNRIAAKAPESAPVRCPYPGMQPFKADDALHFHGRKHEVDEMLGRLRDGQREVYVIGPSGSGKSSLVAAGLIPRLCDHPDLAGGSYIVRQLRPGPNPTATLAGVLEATVPAADDAAAPWLGDAVGRLLASHPPHDRLLIVVDQLEELFTIAAAVARADFIAAVRVLRADVRVALVLTLRADFYAALMESALWADLEGRLSRLDIGPLRGGDLQTAIEAPARALGVYVEPVLVLRLLHDVGDEPGALPLLQDVLLGLWHQRVRGLLRMAEYDGMRDGTNTGLTLTVARRADGALNDLSPGRQDIAWRVLLRLVQFGDGAAVTRRQQSRAALATASDAPGEIDTVIRHLADGRLVTTSAGNDAAGMRVDLAHEILLSAWSELGERIRVRKDDEQRRRVLEAKAAEWVTRGRGESRLLDPGELQEARAWLTPEKAREVGVSAEIEDLLARSEAAVAASIADAERHRRRLWRWATVAVVALTVGPLAILVVLEYASQIQAEREAAAALQDLRDKASHAGEGDAAFQAAFAAYRMHRDRLGSHLPEAIEPVAEIERAALARPVASLLIGGHVYDLQVAGGEVTAVVADHDDRVVVRWRRGEPIAPVTLGAAARMTTLAVLSPDGSRVATEAGGCVALWDSHAGAPADPVERCGGSNSPDCAQITYLAFSGDT